jgi:cardiolipin synthase
VKLILPSYSDFWGVLYAGRSHYSDLLGAGIQIYERQERLLHAKTVVIDGSGRPSGRATSIGAVSCTMRN